MTTDTGSAHHPDDTRTAAVPRSIVPPLPLRKPRLTLPDGACDTHIHVFGEASRYPLAARRHYTPDACNLGRYRQAADILGISRAIVVQPSVYAFDNRLLLDELRDNDADYRGVAVVEPGIDDATLDAMHALARSNPARLLWATDWPHPGLGTAPMHCADARRRGRCRPPGAVAARRTIASPGTGRQPDRALLGLRLARASAGDRAAIEPRRLSEGAGPCR